MDSTTSGYKAAIYRKTAVKTAKQISDILTFVLFNFSILGD